MTQKPPACTGIGNSAQRLERDCNVIARRKCRMARNTNPKTLQSFSPSCIIRLFLQTMPHCMVPGCTNDSKTTKGTEISYHRLPKDKKLSRIWVQKTKRQNPPKFESCYVCCKHFEPECFKHSFKKLAGQKIKKTLLPGAVPTIFKFKHGTEKRERVISIKRRQKREKEVSPHIIINSKPSCFY